MIDKNKVQDVDVKSVFSVCVPIQWGDMDALGHLNNIFYFRYMEEARIKWLQSLGERIDNSTRGPVLFDAHCVYYKPVVYPATLRIELSSEPPRRSNFNLVYDMHCVEKEELVAQGKTKIVWVDYTRMKSVSLPDRLKSLLI